MKANHASVKKKINIAKGQLEGIIKMIDEDSYCLDISNQLLAVISLLKSANNEVITAHVSSCVRNAKTEEELKTKVDELKQILDRISK